MFNWRRFWVGYSRNSTFCINSYKFSFQGGMRIVDNRGYGPAIQKGSCCDFARFSFGFRQHLVVTGRMHACINFRWNCLLRLCFFIIVGHSAGFWCRREWWCFFANWIHGYWTACMHMCCVPPLSNCDRGLVLDTCLSDSYVIALGSFHNYKCCGPLYNASKMVVLIVSLSALLFVYFYRSKTNCGYIICKRNISAFVVFYGL